VERSDLGVSASCSRKETSNDLGSSLLSDDASPGYCHLCNVARPKMSVHCSICHRCVCRRSHHCLLLDCCIGRGNMKFFNLFIICTIIMECLAVLRSLPIVISQFFFWFNSDGCIECPVWMNWWVTIGYVWIGFFAMLAITLFTITSSVSLCLWKVQRKQGWGGPTNAAFLTELSLLSADDE
jgi:hypothetical protein